MEDFRSKSCRGGTNMQQIESYHGPPTTMHELRSYSVSYGRSTQPNQLNKEMKLKKSKSTFASTSKSWSFVDPELQRTKRVAGYKAYAVEGKIKGSLKESFRWIKHTYSQIVYGWR